MRKMIPLILGTLLVNACAQKAKVTELEQEIYMLPVKADVKLRIDEQFLKKSKLNLLDAAKNQKSSGYFLSP